MVLAVVLALTACQHAQLAAEAPPARPQRLYLSSDEPSEERLRDLIAQMESALRNDLLLRPDALEEHFGFRIQDSIGLGMRTANAVALPEPPIYLRARFELDQRRGPVLTLYWYGRDQASIGEAEISRVLGSTADRFVDLSFHSQPMPFTDTYFIGDPSHVLQVRYSREGRVDEIKIRLVVRH